MTDAAGGPGRGPVGFALAALAVAGVLLGLVGLLFNPFYVGAVPVPMGALLSILVMPWLVLRAAELGPGIATAATPVTAWGITVVAVGLTGPGGDVLLPATWQSILLCVGGATAGMWALARVGDPRARRGPGDPGGRDGPR